MFVEPVALNAEVWDGPFQFEVREGKVAARIPARLLRDPEGGPIILWYFRHNLAHMHYCPYNLKTVQTLARAAYEEARRRVARFLKAEEREVIFVRNTTEAMNLVAYAWGLRNLKEGGEETKLCTAGIRCNMR